MNTIWQDLRYGARMLMKKPGFTLIAVITLALGIGANTAIFSVVNAALIRALPYHNPDQLILLSTTATGGLRDLMSMEEMREFQTRAQSLEDVAGVVSQSVNLTGGERPDRVRGAYVTTNFFQVFNLKPVVGRTFAPGEDRPGAEKVVVVNEKIWRERLGGDPWNMRTWCSDISPGCSTTSTARDSSTSTAISWPRESRLWRAKVSRCATCPAWVPGIMRMAPLSTELSEKATHAVTTSGSLNPQ